MHRGGSLSKEEEGEVGPQEEGEGEADEETPPVPPARSVSEFSLFNISVCPQTEIKFLTFVGNYENVHE